MTVERETPQAVEQLYACGFGSYGTRGCGTKHHAQASLLKVVRLSDKRYYDEALGQGPRQAQVSVVRRQRRLLSLGFRV